VRARGERARLRGHSRFELRHVKQVSDGRRVGHAVLRKPVEKR
jgi:hypothetical protein